MALVGTEMDWVEDDLRAEFVFNNPNSKVIKLINKQAPAHARSSFILISLCILSGNLWMWRKFPHLRVS